MIKYVRALHGFDYCSNNYNEARASALVFILWIAHTIVTFEPKIIMYSEGTLITEQHRCGLFSYPLARNERLLLQYENITYNTRLKCMFTGTWLCC